MAENIFLFYPNIIGYVRVVFTFISSYYWFTHPLTSAFFFIMSRMVLDDLDGIAARVFKQATIFGETLDILIDKCSFMVFLMGLCVLYPKYMIFFQVVGFLDVSRTWMRMYSCALVGRSNHKSTILRFYYSALGLHIFSYGSELFFVAIYLQYFSTGPSGYVRVVFTFVSSYYWFTHPLTSAFFFIMSQTVLDDLDGIAARVFKQATIFGGTLDILIDECSFMIFLMGLCVLYPKYMIFFQVVGFWDVFKTWMRMYMYSSALAGQSNHKSAILKFYYSALGLHIFNYGSELFFVAIYLLYFSTGPSGYVRVVFTFVSSYYWFTHPLTSAFFFIMSQMVLDDLDGIAARAFKQATIFGGTLDILIDRCSFMVFLMGLCVLYPKYMIFFQVVGFLDVSRMWMKMYSSALAGQSNHKSTDYAILRFYYSELGLHIFSYGSELFFVAIYLLYFSTGPSVSFKGYDIGLWHILAAITLPIFIIKQPLNILILKVGCQNIAAVDYAKRAKMAKS